MNLMGTGMWGMGFTIANARMKKLLKRLIATPMRKSQYLMAQFLSRLVFLTIEVIVLVAFGWLVFGVRVNGSLAVLALLCIIGAYAFSGRGLLTASRADARGRQRSDEPDHDADVALLRSVLLVRAISRCG